MNRMRALSNSVVETLQSVDKPIFFEPVGGNHGDRLIEMGSRHLLSKLGIITVDKAEDAGAVVINGSGGFAVELWNKDLNSLRWYAQEHKSKPFIILPSSYYFDRSDFPDCFANRRAPAYLFARDRYSYGLIEKQQYPSLVAVGLDHDMAFALGDSEFLRDLKLRSMEKHVLIVERFDFESATDLNRQLPIPDSLKHIVPGPFKRKLKKVLHSHRTARTGFTRSALQRLYQDYPRFVGLPVLCQDISSVAGFTFDQFVDTIADAAAIITTRLHVAILSAMLGKLTFIKTGAGAYQKARGVYEYSMSHWSHVHVW